MLIRPFREVGRASLPILPPVEPQPDPVFHEPHGQNCQSTEQDDCHGRTGGNAGNHHRAEPQRDQTDDPPDPTPHPLASHACCLLRMIQAPSEEGLQIHYPHTIPIRQPSQVLIAPQFWQFGLLAAWAGG